MKRLKHEILRYAPNDESGFFAVFGRSATNRSVKNQKVKFWWLFTTPVGLTLAKIPDTDQRRVPRATPPSGFATPLMRRH